MCILKYLIVFVVIAIYYGIATCDYYTSVSGMEVLLEAEGYLLGFLADFITKWNYTMDKDLLETLGQIREEYLAATNDSFAYLSNPISAFKLIKRFVVDWDRIEEHIRDDVDLSIYLSGVMNDGFQPSTDSDLKGAALGLVRLQESYGLNVAEMADGKILGTKYGSAMSVSDCMELGLSLYKTGEYKRSLPWLLEAKAKLKKESIRPKKIMTKLLRYLSAVYLHVGNPKMALIHTNEILKIDPLDEDALEKQKIYEAKVFGEKNTSEVFRQPLVKPKEPSLEELSVMTCSGERHQFPREQRPLRCIYTTNGIPYRLIGPFKVEQLNLNPLIVYYYQAITDREIRHVIKEAKPKIKRSVIAGDIIPSVVSEKRTSKTGWLYYKHLEVVGTFFVRLEDITGLSLSTADPLQVVNYGIGGHYGLHWDFAIDPLEVYGWRGNRIATALFYLNDVELGGATAFPFLKLAVSPVKGGMVLWYNLHDSLEPDFRTKHTGCPVLKGSKWILNEWFHERGQEFLKPCSLKQQGDVSRQYAFVQ